MKAWAADATQWLLILVVSAAVVAPVLDSGYFGDDKSNFLALDHIAYEGSDPADYAVHVMTSGPKTDGRFWPLRGVELACVALMSLRSYKLFSVGAVLVSIIACGWFIGTALGGQRVAAMVACALPLVLQFRWFHEPVLAHVPRMQLVVVWTALSLGLFERYLREGTSRFVVAATVVHTANLLTYEITYPFYAFHIALAMWRTRRLAATLRATFPILAVTAAAVLLALWFRSQLEHQFHTYVISNTPSAYLPALVKQTLSAFPLTFYVADWVAPYIIAWQPILPHSLQDLAAQVQASDLAYATLYAGLLIHGLRGAHNLPRAALMLFGLLWLVLPAAMVALSPVYQSQLQFGVGYLPVYMQQFGVAMLLAGTASLLLAHVRTSRARRVAMGAIVVVGSTSLLLNLQNNREIVRRMNALWHDEPTLLAASLRAGLLADVPERATIVMLNTALSSSPSELLFRHTGRRFRALGETSLAQSQAQQPVYAIRAAVSTPGSGRITRARILDVAGPRVHVAQICTHEIGPSTDPLRCRVPDDPWVMLSTLGAVSGGR